MSKNMKIFIGTLGGIIGWAIYKVSPTAFVTFISVFLTRMLIDLVELEERE